MTVNDYQKSAMRTNDGKINDRVICSSLWYDEYRTGFNPGELLNGALGLTGEAGEVAELIKKHIFHGHALSTGDLVKELGDVCWYLALLSTAIGVSLEDIMIENIEKLKRRYPEGFSSEASIKRED